MTDPEKNEHRRYNIATSIYIDELKKYNEHSSVDYEEVASDAVTATDALLKALKQPTV